MDIKNTVAKAIRYQLSYLGLIHTCLSRVIRKVCDLSIMATVKNWANKAVSIDLICNSFMAF